jgi:hypothetical protein
LYLFANSDVQHIAGADPGFQVRGDALKKIAPSELEKNMIFWRKIVIFHTKYPKSFRASLRLGQFF